MDGRFDHLTIKGILADENKSFGEVFSEFTAQFNPETWPEDRNTRYDSSQAHGTNGTDPKFGGVKPRIFKFDFFLDGTGASGSIDVLEQIDLFKHTTGFAGEIHRPSFCIIAYGTFIALCVLKNMNVKYTSFKVDGSPLKATINAEFVEHTSNEAQELISNLTSPDLTHVRTTKASDTLPLMCQNIYRDPKLYLEVARVNGIDNFRTLKPGKRITFPPIES